MILFGKKQKMLLFSISLSLIMGIVSFGTTILRNYSNQNICEFISNDICEEIKISKASRVEMTIAHKNTSFSWFKNNESAVEEIAVLQNNDSVYMRYESVPADRFSIDSSIDEIALIGNANTRASVIPYNIKILAGKYDYRDFNLDKERSSLENYQPVIVSKALAKRILNLNNLNKHEDLINYIFSDSTNGRKFVIKCVAEDDALFSKDSNDLFIFSSFFAFSTYYNDETMVYQFSNDRYTNYTLIYYTLYFIYKSSTSNILTLEFTQNKWITEQFMFLFNRSAPSNYYGLLAFAVTLLSSALLSFLFLHWKKTIYPLKFGTILIIFIFLLFRISLLNIFNCFMLAGLNINTFIGAGYFDVLVMIFGFTLFHLLFSKIQKNNQKQESDSYYEVDI